jgi:hypothetical protein
MTTYAKIGSISSGTLRPEDLIPSFVDALDSIKDDLSTSGIAENAITVSAIDDLLSKIEQRMKDDNYFETEDASYDLEALTDELNNHAPHYAYFGSHPGDGADFGFWIVEDVAQCVKDDGGLVVDDTSEVPDDFTGTVLHVNDHGNATLYSADHGELSEVWAVV